MTKLTLLFVLLSSLTAPAFAITDYTCVNDCTSKGYMYSVCVSKCSASDNPSPNRQTDYTCVNDCTAQGYLYGVCVGKCSTN